MDLFEKKMQQRKKRQIRFFLMLPVLIAVALGIFAYAYVYHINSFDIKMQLNGEEHVVLEYGEPFEDPGAVAVFSGSHLLRDGMEIPVSREGSVDESLLGTYELKYLAEHESWKAEVTRTVEIVDTKDPQIWLAEKLGSYILPGETYREDGFMARDNYDGDLTDKVVKTAYRNKIIYTVEDSSGNKAQAIRTIVYYDPEPPVLTLLGKSEITITAGQSYQEPGFVATDNCDGDLTDRVVVSGTVNTKRAGTYKIYYSVEDSFGNTDTAVRVIRVKAQPKPKPKQPEVTPSGKVIYLTFDDGPSQHTEELLRVLKKYNVKATFFVVKTSRMDLLDDIVSQGHSIAAHTYSHNYNKIYASEEAYFADLDKILDVIESKTGVRTKLLRFPGGSSNKVSRFNEGIMSRLANDVVDRGYRYFDWNVDSNDAGGAKTAEQVYKNVINGVKNRKISIVLQHDTKGYSVDAVEKIIQWGLEHGYKFLALKENSPTAAHDIQN